jgi:hypothetical protein
MATLVQSDIGDIGAGLAFTSNVTAGNIIIAMVMSPLAGDTITVADSQANSYTQAGAAASSATGDICCKVFYATAGSTGACTVTATTGVEVADGCVAEVSGTSLTADGFSATGSAGAGSANPNSGTVTPTGSGYSWGYIANDLGNLTFNSPLTDREALSNFGRTEFGDNAANASGFSANATLSSSNWVAVAGHLKEGSAGTTMQPAQGAAALTGTSLRMGFTINMPDEA